MRPVAALFVRHDSVYKSIPGVECYDQERDALTFPGGMPIIAHPPCRTWGKLRQFSTQAPKGEHELAIWAVEQIDYNGGILEHPSSSFLWRKCHLPLPLQTYNSQGKRYTLAVEQFWWGHYARKRTWLYIVGIPLHALPPLPVVLGEPTHTVRGDARQGKPGLSHTKREQTPPRFAEWLVSAARTIA